MNGAFASGAADLGLVPSRVKPMTVKLAFTAFPFDAPSEGKSVEDKPASLLVVSLKYRPLAGFPHLKVIDRWLATPKRARYSALIAFS